MKEDQNIENKESWHDDHLKVICGFANAQGGTLYIGVSDSGKLVGLQDAKRLLEELPGKIRNHLGIHCEVNLFGEYPSNHIEVNVLPFSVAISLRGRYYYRSGTSTIELTGSALNEFLLKRSGKTWDDIIEPTASWDDIDLQTVNFFRDRAAKSGRMADDESDKVQDIFEKLRLSEKGVLKRAAIILFAKDPGKFYPNLQIKIGRFGRSDSELIYQVYEEGNLFILLRNTGNQLNNKFLINKVDFEGFYRVEKGEYPMPAIREMMLNALVHRNYNGSFTQLRVYEDRISLWNDGSLPEGMTLDALYRKHPSKPRNPLIADVCFKSGLIEAWGRGTLKIIDTCKEAGLPIPSITEVDGGLMVELYKDRFSEKFLKEYELNERQHKVIVYLKENPFITNSIYRSIIMISERTASRDLEELVKKGLLIKEGQKRSSRYVLFGR